MRYYTVEIDGAEKVAVSENGKELYISRRTRGKL